MDVQSHIENAIERVKKVGIKPTISSIKKTDMINWSVQGNFTIVNIVRDKKIYTGVSKKVPSDRVNNDAGLAIASKRAIMDEDTTFQYEMKHMDNKLNKSMVKVPFELFEQLHNIVWSDSVNKLYDRKKINDIAEQSLALLNNLRDSFAKKYHKGAYKSDKD